MTAASTTKNEKAADGNSSETVTERIYSNH